MANPLQLLLYNYGLSTVTVGGLQNFDKMRSLRMLGQESTDKIECEMLPDNAFEL